MSQHNLQQTQDLEQAFDAFTRMSVQLESSYRDLENQVAVLNGQLAEANSERLKQLAAKESLADRLERLLELLPAAVLVLNGDSCITKANLMADEMLQIGLIGKRWDDVLTGLIDADCSTGTEVRLVNGRYVTISTRSLGSEPGQLVLISDVSDQHQMQTMLQRQERLTVMGEMAANLSHQIRTPLSTALLYASNLQNENLKNTDRKRMSTKVVERLRHLEHMVNDILKFAKGSAFSVVDVDLRSLLQQFSNIIAPQIERMHGQLNLPELKTLIEIQGDHESLLAVLINLAENSLQASIGNPVITIDAHINNDSQVVISFRDNGPGIDSDHIDKIFTPFFTTRSQGTGLGLAVAQATVQAHKGSISYMSHKDSGALFEICLPQADENRLLPSGSSTFVINRG